MNNIETLLQKRATLQGDLDGKKVLEKQKLQVTIDKDISSVKQNLDQLNTVFTSQQKKKDKVKFYNK